MARRSNRSRSGKGTINFGIEVKASAEKIGQSFGVASRAFGDYRPAFRRIAPHFARGLGQNIRTRGAAIGKAWPTGQSIYDRRKQREGFGTTDAVRHRTMLEQVTSPTASILSMGRKVLRVGSSLPYARSVNFRGYPFAGVNDSMRSSTEVEMTDHVRTQLKALADELRRGMANA